MELLMTHTYRPRRPFLKLTLAALLASAAIGAFAQKPLELLNVSYDPTRELYSQYNAAFVKH